MWSIWVSQNGHLSLTNFLWKIWSNWVSQKFCKKYGLIESHNRNYFIFFNPFRDQFVFSNPFWDLTSAHGLPWPQFQFLRVEFTVSSVSSILVALLRRTKAEHNHQPLWRPRPHHEIPPRVHCCRTLLSCHLISCDVLCALTPYKSTMCLQTSKHT